MNTAPSPVRERTEEEEKKRRNLLPLFLLLFFLLLATSCIVGFLLGRTTEPGRFGALIDTIVLEPNDPDPVQTGGEGLGADVRILGLVRYGDGEAFTEGKVELRSEPQYAELDGAGNFSFDQVPMGRHELSVLDWEGDVLARRIIQLQRDAAEEPYISYEGEVCVVHIQTLTVELKLVLVLEREAGGLLTVALPEGNPEPGGDDGPVASGVPAVGDGPGIGETPGPGASETPEPTPAPSAEPTPEPTAEPTPAPTPGPVPEPPGTVEVYHGESGTTWIQEAVVDLFRPLHGEEAPVIAPGSEGYYLFRLENGRRGTVRFTLSIQEGTFHVPLEYRLLDEETGDVLLDWQTASMEDNGLVSGAQELSGRDERRCRLEWRWPFEGDDAADTALGARDDRTYTLKLTIRAEDA